MEDSTLPRVASTGGSNTSVVSFWRQRYVAMKRFLIDSFEIDERKTTIGMEIFAGYIHFISCLFVLPVIPNQLAAAHYDKTLSIQATALASAAGCMLSSYVTNLPFVIAPPTAVSIFLAVALQQNGMMQEQGNAAVVLSGCVLLLIGIFKPLTEFVTKLIPDCIQASTAVGIGLITALAGAIELDLVVAGKYTIVQMGPVTPAIIIAVLGTTIIALAMHFHFKGAFVSGLVFGTLTWWWYEERWPTEISSFPELNFNLHLTIDYKVIVLLFNLLFLYVLTLNGIARSMSDLAGLTNVDNSIPRGNWLFIMCGVATILSGYLSGPPILISPESAGGIKAGAKTGLSSLVCGLLFFLSVFFSPVLSAVPPAGTSPLLIMVGMMLFMNTSRIKWNHIPEAVPAFFVLLLIPFTYSILCGVGFGYVFYIAIGLFSGELVEKASILLSNWRQSSYETINNHREKKVETEETEYIDEMQCNADLYGGELKSDLVLDPANNRNSITRVRTGSIVDRLSMDLSSGIKSMQA